MAWFSTTRWIDRDIDSLDAALDLFMSDNEDTNNDGGIVYSNLIKEKEFPQNQNVMIDSRAISYNVVNFSMNSITPGLAPIEERTQQIRGMIIVYSDGNRVRYIINRNSDARKLLRKLLGYTGRNEIVENKFSFTDDIFMWFVKSVFSKESEFLFTDLNQNENSLIINSIIGVRGETRDENRLSAHGDTVLNLISTLSFILESNLLKQIILRTEYTVHENIEIRLNDKGVVAVDIDSYSGNYENLDDPRKKAQVLLLVYLDIIPKLLQTYFSEVNDETWGLVEKDIFFENVKNKLLERLTVRKEEFKAEQTSLPIEQIEGLV